MNMDSIRVFQVDDWAFVEGQSEDDAAALIEKEYGRPDDPFERELDEVTKTTGLQARIAAHVETGAGFPVLIGIDGHYA